MSDKNYNSLLYTEIALIILEKEGLDHKIKNTKGDSDVKNRDEIIRFHNRYINLINLLGGNNQKISQKNEKINWMLLQLQVKMLYLS